jgi:hypothetical protein
MMIPMVPGRPFTEQVGADAPRVAIPKDCDLETDYLLAGSDRDSAAKCRRRANE